MLIILMLIIFRGAVFFLAVFVSTLRLVNLVYYAVDWVFSFVQIIFISINILQCSERLSFIVVMVLFSSETGTEGCRFYTQSCFQSLFLSVLMLTIHGSAYISVSPFTVCFLLCMPMFEYSTLSCPWSGPCFLCLPHLFRDSESLDTSCLSGKDYCLLSPLALCTEPFGTMRESSLG